MTNLTVTKENNMNKRVVDFMRNEIKKDLKKLNDDCQLLFKRMYFHNNLQASIDDVVDNIEEEKLNWAMTQVDNSLTKPHLIRLEPTCN